MLQQLRKKNIVEWYIKKHEEEKIQLLSITFNLIFFFFKFRMKEKHISNFNLLELSMASKQHCHDGTRCSQL